MCWLHTRHTSGQEQQAQTSVDRDPAMPTPKFKKKYRHTKQCRGRHAAEDSQLISGHIYRPRVP